MIDAGQEIWASVIFVGFRLPFISHSMDKKYFPKASGTEKTSFVFFSHAETGHESQHLERNKTKNYNDHSSKMRNK